MDTYLNILHTYWGYPDFRGIQRDIIESIGAGRDTLGLMPTGGGKSITFQVPALAMEGVCIVVSPLVALMKDQVAHLRERNIMAAAVYADMSRQEILKTLDNCVLGSTNILYVSPERLSSETFLAKLRHMKVSFITVDEAHCISQWGYDFRPSYLQIANLRTLLPHCPVLALTATATPKVVDDIMDRLGFKERNVFRMSFERKNLAYIVRTTTDKDHELAHILRSVPGSAIVYARSRRHTKELAGLLSRQGIETSFFHAGLDASVKDQRQTDWQQGKQRVMVCTNAFGMGIDKADVRLVVHYDLPDSIEAYFQEAGRAGRDGKKAYAVLLYNNSDRQTMKRRVAYNFPEKEYIRNVYDHLAYFFTIGEGSGTGHTFEFDIGRFSFTYGFYPLTVDSALKLLQNAGYIAYDTNPDSAARCTFLLNRDDLYRLDENSEMEENIVTQMLRHYSGLFSDYVYIDLGFIAAAAGCTNDQVYNVLKSLSQRRIINFIPQRRTPTITYLRPRVLHENIVITPEVYEKRKEQYVERVKAMLDYAQNDSICRSRQLLAYFGERSKHDCHQCDVCLAHERKPDKKQMEATAKAIMDILADHKRHYLIELRDLPFPTAIVDSVLEELVQEECIHVDGAFIYA